MAISIATGLVLFIAVLVCAYCLHDGLSDKKRLKWDTSAINQLPRFPVTSTTKRNLFYSANTKSSILKGLVDCSAETVLCDVRTPSSCASCSRADVNCTRLNAPTVIKKRSGEDVTLNPNNQSDPHEGYCLETMSSQRDEPFVCNVNTGDAILIKKGKGDAAGLTFNCVCKYPNLVDQKIPFTSDCNVERGCGGGKLVSKPGYGDWREGSVLMGDDLKNATTCVDCPVGTISTTNQYGFPVCASTSVSLDFDDSLYKKIITWHSPVANGPLRKDVVSDQLLPISDTNAYGSPSHALEPSFVAQMANSIRNVGRVVPNPCAFDALTGKPFIRNECALASARGDSGEEDPDKRIYYCVSNLPDTIGIQLEDDYLRNNGGKWCNACTTVATGTDHESVPRISFEWFNRPRQSPDVSVLPPIIGLEVNVDKLTEAIKSALVDIKGKNAFPENTKTIRLYSAPVPDRATVLPYPIDSRFKSLFYRASLDPTSMYPSICTYYAVKNFKCGLRGVRSSVPIPKCRILGAPIEHVTPYVPKEYYWDTDHIIPEEEYIRQLTTIFPVCRDDDGHFSFVPNVNATSANLQAQGFTGIYFFDTKSQILVAEKWSTDDVEIQRYIKHLPSMPN